MTYNVLTKPLASAMLAFLALDTAFSANYLQTDGTNTTGGLTITVASGDTLEISGKVTGTGRLTTSGSGTLILSNEENDWTGGIKVGKGGALKVTPENWSVSGLDFGIDNLNATRLR